MGTFKEYSSALRDHVKQWIKDLGQIDILIGIPSFNNEDTIQNVLEKVGEGLKKHYPDAKSAILVSDGGSLDDTREHAQAASVPSEISRMVTIYRGIPGKGTSFRAVFECAMLAGAKACAVYDADLRSISPDWVKNLIEPILEDKADFVAPYYVRHKFDGTITNHIVYPITRALYGKDVRQPIGGDFGFSGKMAEIFFHKDVWQSDVARFGVDIWMTTVALAEGHRIVQANLGAKIHDPKDPSADLGPMFHQVISTMFYLMGIYEDKWKNIKGHTTVPIWNHLETVPQVPSVEVTLPKLRHEFYEGFEQFRALYETVLMSENVEELQKIYQKAKYEGRMEFPPELWARILYDIAFIYQTWTRNRRRLVSIMTPLYFGRVGAYCEEVANLSNEEAEKIIQKQAGIFEQYKYYLIDKFQAWE